MSSDLQEILKAIDEDDKEFDLLGMDMMAPQGEPLTANIMQAVKIMQREPLLQAPAVKWLLQKEAEIANAKLGVLYTPEELEAMKQEASG